MNKLNIYIHDPIQRKLIPGLSLAVIKDGATLTEKSYGFANIEHNVPTTSHTIEEI